MLLSRGGAAAALGLLPRDAFTLLEKHTVPGLLTRTLTLTLALALTLTLTLTPTLTPTPAREAHGTRPPNPNPDLKPSQVPGLQATYQARPFGPKKLNLRKVRKLLVALAPAAETRLPATPPPLPELLGAQLFMMLLQPPASAGGAGGAVGPEAGASLEAWCLAAASTP